MGRQQDLERLALGRSALQEPFANDEGPSQDSQSNVAPPSHDLEVTAYNQHYDNKGRPINPTTEATNHAMRHAQNAVIALTGAVESREASNRDAQHQRQTNRTKLLEFEDERGKDLTLLSALLRVLLIRWPESSIARIQAGVYIESSTFADVVLRDLTVARYGGIRQCIDIFFGGLPLEICYQALKSLLVKAMGQLIGRLQSVLDRKLPAKHSKRASDILLCLLEVVVVAIDIALLPLPFYVAVQKLNLAPSWPLLPDWRMLLPWNTSSLHFLIWRPIPNMTRFGMLCSPAAMFLLQNTLSDHMDAEVPYTGKTVTCEESPINEPTSYSIHEADQGLFESVILICYRLRKNILRWAGWTVEYIQRHPPIHRMHQNNHILEPIISNQSDWSQSIETGAVCRSTSLAHLPVQCLAERIDDIYLKLLTLPWQSCLLRAVTRSFLTSTLSSSSYALSMTSYGYSPLGGGPFGLIRQTGNWDGAVSYASKVGLGIALNCSIEFGIFFAMYNLTRWQGVRNFDWGKASNITPAHRRNSDHPG